MICNIKTLLFRLYRRSTFFVIVEFVVAMKKTPVSLGRSTCESSPNEKPKHTGHKHNYLLVSLKLNTHCSSNSSSSCCNCSLPIATNPSRTNIFVFALYTSRVCGRNCLSWNRLSHQTVHTNVLYK